MDQREKKTAPKGGLHDARFVGGYNTTLGSHSEMAGM